MHKMVTFEFYRDIYLGSAIGESKFPQLAQRAEAELARLKRCYRVEGGEEAQAMAICAMAESLFACTGRSAGVQAATVGGVSVRYWEDTDMALRRRLYQQAAVYLDIYRGCENG